MTFEHLATRMSREVYEQLKTAIEIGRWPNGLPLTQAQKEISLEAVLRFETANLPPEQRTGYLPPKMGSDRHSCKQNNDYDDVKPLNWQDK